jgi:2-oxoglutarate/2-oxoacid ferredoxin oxidoreductase subunit beta
MSVTVQDYTNSVENAWCPGCGNFVILNAVKTALAERGLPPHRVLICSGIGQAPKLPHYLNCNALNGLHGREVASATAAKLAAEDLTVLVHAGDGGALGEGGNHFLAAIRRNPDFTLVIHDNRVYGLTQGQASPTTPVGSTAKLQLEGVALWPMNQLALAISQSGSFVAQASAAHKEHLVQVLTQAIEHRGLSMVNVLQPCPTWDKVHTYPYYREHCYELGPEHEPTDQLAALQLVLFAREKLPLGILYRNDRPAYEDVVLSQRPRPLRDRPLEPRKVAELFEDFA